MEKHSPGQSALYSLIGHKGDLIYGLGGIFVPFVGIKVIDLMVNAIGLA